MFSIYLQKKFLVIASDSLWGGVDGWMKHSFAEKDLENKQLAMGQQRALAAKAAHSILGCTGKSVAKG